MPIEIEDIDCRYDGSSTIDVAYDFVKHQTEDAVLFEIDATNHWIPKAVIASLDRHEVQVAAWFARKEGLE